MDYEKKYKEALERAKYYQKENSSAVITAIFPELKESENERIRKELLSVVNDLVLPNEQQSRFVAWLEKQDKKELANFDEAEKEKADFVGDGFIKCFANFLDFKEGNTYWLEYIGDDKYNVRSDNLLGKTYHITPCQLYTVFKKQICLEKQGEQKPQGKSALEAISEEKVDNTNKVKPKSEFKVGDWIVHNSSNTLYKIVAFNSGYCSLIDINGIHYNPCICPNGYYHLWTLFDAKNGDILHSPSLHLIWIYKDNETAHVGININYPLSLSINTGLVTPNDACLATKEQREQLEKAMADAGYTFDFEKKELKRIEQKSVEWSEEDEKMLSDIIEFGAHDRLTPNDISWLNSLRNRVQPKPKQEWSEEDEQIILSIEQVMNCASLLNIVPEKLNKINKWLKSLKQRYTWKPSEEQIEALEHFVRSIGESDYASPYENNTKLLCSLLEQLKKLK